MSGFDTSSEIPDGPTKRWTPAARLTDLSERIARTLSALDRSTRGTPHWDEEADSGESVLPPKWEASNLFPSARNGYDRASVDAHVTELQRELDELRDRTPERVVAEEIDRIGKQTSEIIRLAHDKADEITSVAQANAERTVDEAARKARERSEEAERHLHELDAETDTVWRDRRRLVEDVRGLATALFALAEDAADKFPPEGPQDDEEPQDVASVGGPLDVPSGRPIKVEDLRQPSHGLLVE
jgi:hypothetical protein